MKKIILSIIALTLLVGASSVFAATLTDPTKTVIPRDTLCINKKVTARELAIIAAYKKMSGGITNALNNRATELTSAWNIPDTKIRKKAITQAWNKYIIARKAFIKTYRQEVAVAWKKAKTDMKTCKINGQTINVVVDEPVGEKSDGALE
jgi:hypothetical protein